MAARAENRSSSGKRKKMYFGTDPVAIDKTGWKAIEAGCFQRKNEAVISSEADGRSATL